MKEQHKYWQDMKFDHNKHDVEQFAYDLKVLGKMLGMSDEQLLENFKEAFPFKIEVVLLEINNVDTAIGKAKVLILLFKHEFHDLEVHLYLLI